MTETLATLLRTVVGEDPSPNFLAKLQNTIETESLAGREATTEAIRLIDRADPSAKTSWPERDEPAVFDPRRPGDDKALTKVDRVPFARIGVAASVLLMIGVFVMTNTDDGVIDSASTPGLTDPSCSPYVADLTSPSQWSRVPHDEATFGGSLGLTMNSVTSGGPGLVAVGSAGVWFNFGPDTAAVWTSVDGVAWCRAQLMKTVSSGSMNSVTEGGPGLVAVGSDRGAAAVWTSVDGLTWSKVPHDIATFGAIEDRDTLFPSRSIFPTRSMNSVTAGGPGLVAAGSDRAAAAVWTSVDGLTWSRVPHNETVFGQQDGYGGPEIREVTTGGPGLVAVGEDDGSPAVWASTDGVAWSRVPRDDTVFGTNDESIVSLNSVTAGGPGLVAVGSVADHAFALTRRAAVWTSVDGLTWSRVPHDEAVFPDEQGMQDVTASDFGLVAVGGEVLPVNLAGRVEERDAVVWTSADGVTWSKITQEDDAIFGGRGSRWMASVTVGRPGLVAVGSNNFGVVDAAVWVMGTDGP